MISLDLGDHDMSRLVVASNRVGKARAFPLPGARAVARGNSYTVTELSLSASGFRFEVHDFEPPLGPREVSVSQGTYAVYD